ncbi:MAG TPA: hypothetical protein PL123_12585 [Bacteroidales bacterium]|nr:hypothetical protein [Bacteroidales bacterium]
MKKAIALLTAVLIIALNSCKNNHQDIRRMNDTILFSDTIQYHPVRISKEDGSILPWFSADKGESYDTVLMLVWDFWDKMETDSNGLKYFMNHQVWKPGHDMRGLGGDQINMALSSWRLLYAYTGYPEVIDNMRYMADTYLDRSLSAADDKWPFIPYPYNTDIHSGRYDGDMRNGKGITQPDKAGSFGYELVSLYKMTGEKKYLEAAIRIAETLALKTEAGDSVKSPLPFRVNAKTGETGSLFDNMGSGKKVRPALYTSNWTGTMLLFEEMQVLDTENRDLYKKCFDTFLSWMEKYPLRTNKWGPFFEDIPGWSDTQTNAISFAQFIMEHRNLFPEWEKDVKNIIEWTYRELGNTEYEKYKVVVMNEQTVYRVPGNSHSSRQASIELLYASLTGDSSYTENAIRTLNWATYTVAPDGRNRYIRDDIWLTDGYGDYVRHYLRAMAVRPDLAPAENHLLSSSSVVKSVSYEKNMIVFKTWDINGDVILRLTDKPEFIRVNGKEIPENDSDCNECWRWMPLERGGVVSLSYSGGNNIEVSF